LNTRLNSYPTLQYSNSGGGIL